MVCEQLVPSWGTTSANAISFSAPGPFDGSTTYYFRIRAQSTSGNSVPVSVTTAAFPYVLRM